jgi:ADP-ribose pyrophosphatase YjhB (NUDIX family)
MATTFFTAVKALVRDTQGRLLLVRDTQRGWEPPGGTVEPDEDLLTALRREVREESGVEIHEERLACVVQSGSRPPWLLFYFHVDHASGEARPAPECPEVAWCTPEDALARITHPMIRETMSALLANRPPFYRAYQGPRHAQRISLEQDL